MNATRNNSLLRDLSAWSLSLMTAGISMALIFLLAGMGDLLEKF
jgi:hypothetical protein